MLKKHFCLPQICFHLKKTFNQEVGLFSSVIKEGMEAVRGYFFEAARLKTNNEGVSVFWLDLAQNSFHPISDNCRYEEGDYCRRALAHPRWKKEERSQPLIGTQTDNRPISEKRNGF